MTAEQRTKLLSGQKNILCPKIALQGFDGLEFLGRRYDVAELRGQMSVL